MTPWLREAANAISNTTSMDCLSKNKNISLTYPFNITNAYHSNIYNYNIK